MSAKIIVAGHICLDIIPTFLANEGDPSARIEPGQIYLMGPAVCATGGAVSNTGLALHQLGIPTTLMGKVADDPFGSEVLNILRRYGSELADSMIVTNDGNTSYSIVISPPNVDRAFLHCPGTNDTFSSDDVDLERLEGAKLFHFGYPTLMQQFYLDGGRQMGQLLGRVKEHGLTTSLDMALPDPQSAAGQIDWRSWLEQVLPAVDLFLPSIEETMFMLDSKKLEGARRELLECPPTTRVSQPPTPNSLAFDTKLLAKLADELLAMGTGGVVLKLGEQGLYLRTGEDGCKLAFGRENPDRDQGAWKHRELLAPCFEVEVAGTTGAGDSAIAGFLAALISGYKPEEALVQAVGVGACSVESADATSGICSVGEVQNRIAANWKRRQVALKLDDWTWDKAEGVWRSPRDGNAL